MTLVIDIGNSYIKSACFKDDKLLEDTFSRFETSSFNSLDIKNIIPNKISEVIVSSVVNEVTETVCGVIKQVTGIFPKILKKDFKPDIYTNIAEPESIGGDLLADIYGSFEHSKKARLIIDLGTVTKLLLIDEQGCFVGANFVPGFEASANSLSRDTSLLPKVKLKYPNHILGVNTNDAMITGIMCGSKFMLDGFIKYYKEQYHGLKVIFTGGGSDFVTSQFKGAIFDKFLTIKGIYKCFKESR